MSALKKQPLLDITNTKSNRNERIKKHCNGAVYDMLPIAFPNKLSSDSIDCTMIAMQNKHPSLAMYNPDINTESISFTDFEELCDANKECQMLNFLTEVWLLPSSQQCLLCGNNMRHSKQAKTWYWICTRRVNGKKCNSAKFSVRRGTFFDNSKLSIQSILRIVWNFRINRKMNSIAV